MNVFQLLHYKFFRNWIYDREGFRRDERLKEYYIFNCYGSDCYWVLTTKKEYYIELVKETQRCINKQREINKEYKKAIRILNGEQLK